MGTIGAAATLALLVLSGASQPPPPAPPKHAEANQSQASSEGDKRPADQSATEPPSAALNLDNAPASNRQVNQSIDQSQNSTPEEWWRFSDSGSVTAWLTFVLAISAIVQFVASILQWCSMRSQLKLARDEFESSHRPKVRLRHFVVYVPEDITSFSPAINFSWGFNVSNVGDKGISDFYVVYATVWADDQRNAIAELETSGKTHRFHSGMKPGGQLKVSFPQEAAVESTYVTVVGAASKHFFVIGKVVYTDASGVQRSSGFIRKCPISKALLSGGFQKIDDCDYEYED